MCVCACVCVFECAPVAAGPSPSVVFGRYEWAALVFGSLEAFSLAQQPYLSLTLMAIFCICHIRSVFACLWREGVSGKRNEGKMLRRLFQLLPDHLYVVCMYVYRTGCVCVHLCTALGTFVCVCVCVCTYLSPAAKGSRVRGNHPFFPFLSLWKMALCLRHTVHTHIHTHCSTACSHTRKYTNDAAEQITYYRFKLTYYYVPLNLSHLHLIWKEKPLLSTLND